MTEKVLATAALTNEVLAQLLAEGSVTKLAAGTMSRSAFIGRAEFLGRAIIDPVGVSPSVASLVAPGTFRTWKYTTIAKAVHQPVYGNSLMSMSNPSPASPTSALISNLFGKAMRRHMNQVNQMLLSAGNPLTVGEWLEEELDNDPPELPHVGVTDEPVVGYRCWFVRRQEWDSPGYHAHTHVTAYNPTTIPDHTPPTTHHWMLASLTTGTVWRSAILTSDKKPCAYDPHDCRWQERADHGYGIYAHGEPTWGDFRASSGWDNFGLHPQDSVWPAIGRIEGLGQVVEHERGWRAEKVRITRLVLSPGLLQEQSTSHASVLEELEALYRCDVSYDPTTLEASPEENG